MRPSSSSAVLRFQREIASVRDDRPVTSDEVNSFWQRHYGDSCPYDGPNGEIIIDPRSKKPTSGQKLAMQRLSAVRKTREDEQREAADNSYNLQMMRWPDLPFRPRPGSPERKGVFFGAPLKSRKGKKGDAVSKDEEQRVILEIQAAMTRVASIGADPNPGLVPDGNVALKYPFNSPATLTSERRATLKNIFDHHKDMIPKWYDPINKDTSKPTKLQKKLDATPYGIGYWEMPERPKSPTSTSGGGEVNKRKKTSKFANTATVTPKLLTSGQPEVDTAHEASSNKQEVQRKKQHKRTRVAKRRKETDSKLPPPSTGANVSEGSDSSGRGVSNTLIQQQMASLGIRTGATSPVLVPGHGVTIASSPMRAAVEDEDGSRFNGSWDKRKEEATRLRWSQEDAAAASTQHDGAKSSSSGNDNSNDNGAGPSPWANAHGSHGYGPEEPMPLPLDSTSTPSLLEYGLPRSAPSLLWGGSISGSLVPEGSSSRLQKQKQKHDLNELDMLLADDDIFPESIGSLSIDEPGGGGSSDERITCAAGVRLHETESADLLPSLGDVDALEDSMFKAFGAAEVQGRDGLYDSYDATLHGQGKGQGRPCSSSRSRHQGQGQGEFMNEWRQRRINTRRGTQASQEKYITDAREEERQTGRGESRGKGVGSDIRNSSSTHPGKLATVVRGRGTDKSKKRTSSSKGDKDNKCASAEFSKRRNAKKKSLGTNSTNGAASAAPAAAAASSSLEGKTGSVGRSAGQPAEGSAGTDHDSGSLLKLQARPSGGRMSLMSKIGKSAKSISEVVQMTRRRMEFWDKCKQTFEEADSIPPDAITICPTHSKHHHQKHLAAAETHTGHSDGTDETSTQSKMNGDALYQTHVSNSFHAVKYKAHLHLDRDTKLPVIGAFASFSNLNDSERLAKVRLSRSETHSANEILKPVILKRAKLIAPQYSDMNEPLPESFDVTFDTYHAITLDAIISEVVALRQIGSDAPNIIKFHGLTTAPPWGVCLVMERLDGSLEQCLMDTRWQGSTPLRARLSILCDVARALDCVHRKGWCHRAVCPNNVLLSLTDSKGTHRPVAKLCNFAFARKIDHYENGAPHFQPLDVDASHDSNRNDSNKMGRRQSMGSLMRRVTRMALEKANRQKVSDAVQKSTGAGGNDVKLNENLFDGGLGELYLEDVGPCGYLAPELLTNSAKAMGGIGTDGPTIPARGSDIFNFGLLAWEVTARSTPLVAENNPIGMGAPSDDMFGESGRPRARTFTGGSKLTTDDGAVDDDESEVSVKSIDFDQLHKCKLDNPLRGKDPGFIASFLLQGGRPSFGSEQPELLRHMVRACWETRCVSRPSMAVVYHMLEELLSSDLALAQLYDRNLVGRSQLNLLRRGAHPLPTSPARAGSSSSMLSIANTKLTLLPGFKEEVTNATSPMAGAPSGKALQREGSHLQATITTTFQQDQPLPMSKLERDLTSCDLWQLDNESTELSRRYFSHDSEDGIFGFGLDDASVFDTRLVPPSVKKQEKALNRVIFVEGTENAKSPSPIPSLPSKMASPKLQLQEQCERNTRDGMHLRAIEDLTCQVIARAPVVEISGLLFGDNADKGNSLLTKKQEQQQALAANGPKSKDGVTKNRDTSGVGGFARQTLNVIESPARPPPTRVVAVMYITLNEVINLPRTATEYTFYLVVGVDGREGVISRSFNTTASFERAPSKAALDLDSTDPNQTTLTLGERICLAWDGESGIQFQLFRGDRGDPGDRLYGGKGKEDPGSDTFVGAVSFDPLMLGVDSEEQHEKQFVECRRCSLLFSVRMRLLDETHQS